LIRKTYWRTPWLYRINKLLLKLSKGLLVRTALLLAMIVTISPCVGYAAEPSPTTADLFARENLIAWCIVPFDAKHRGPAERASMLKQLGFNKFAYDWRAEHVATFDDEIEALRREGIELVAWWFPPVLDANAQAILAALRRHDLKVQLWVAIDGDPVPAADQQAKVAAAVKTLRPIAELAAKQGCSVGLYNHDGWFGEPENLLAIVESLDLPNVGVVYNLHHGHDHLDRFESALKQLQPHLYAINLNGMDRNGERLGRKILPLGQGELDLELLRMIEASGYRGPLGILGHTQDDAEARLRDNLDGLDWLVEQLSGQPAGKRPIPRTPVPKKAASQAEASLPPK
jgi:sugar phosphate isomerase/epimerase